MGSYCKASGNAGGAAGQMKDSSGGDDGEESLKDDIIQHGLNSEKFQFFVQSQQMKHCL